MKKRKLRSIIAGITLVLALLTSTTAAAWQRVPWIQTNTGTSAVAEGKEFLLVNRDGEVCIYSGNALVSRTGIPVRTLPAQDRKALESGIRAQGEKQLAALLEDFGA